MNLSDAKVEVDLTDESRSVLSGIDPIFHDTAVNLALTLLSKTSIYKKFLMKPTDSIQSEDELNDDQQAIDDISSVKIESEDVIVNTPLNSSPNNVHYIGNENTKSSEKVEVSSTSDNPGKVDWSSF